jgi:DNA-binding protein HU-beta
MNKADLINAVSEQSGLNKTSVKKVLEATVNAFIQGLSAGDKVLLTGFGSFNVVERGPRTGINPKTLKAMPIPAKKFVKFTPGKDIAAKIH